MQRPLLRIELLKIKWTEFHFEQKGVFDLFLEKKTKSKKKTKHKNDWDFRDKQQAAHNQIRIYH